MKFSYRQLQYIRETSLAGSIAEAAKRLNISVSSIRESIAHAEALLGQPLFFRIRAKGVELTPEGRKFLELANPVFAAHEKFERIAFGCADKEQELSIAVVANAGALVLPEWVCEIQQQCSFKRIKFGELNSAEMVEAVRTRQYTAGFGFNDFLHPSLTFEELFSTHVHIALSNEHPLAKRQSIRLEEVIHEPFIFQNFGGAATYYAGLFDYHGLKPDIRFVVESAQMARQFIMQGLGYSTFSIAPRFEKPQNHTSALVRIPIETDYWSPSFGLFFAESCCDDTLALVRRVAKSVWGNK